MKDTDTKDPAEIRGKLTDAFAQAAFDRFNGLQPEWFACETRTASGELHEVYVRPDVMVWHSDGAIAPLGKGRAEGFDDAVANQWKAMVADVTARPGRVVVVNNYSTAGARYYAYDAVSSKFSQVPKPVVRK